MIDKVLTIDLEYDFETDSAESLKFIPHMLELFEENNVTATFFTLGKLAEDYPSLIKKISKKYEIASHGYDHSRLDKMNLNFQLRKSKRMIEQLGIECKGFRSPYFIYPKTLFDNLKEAGYKYDSSISSYFPGRYNNMSIPSEPHMQTDIIELPISNFVGKFFSSGLPYYRLLYPMSKRFKLPYMFYLHPCEFLEHQPENQINGLVKRLYSRNQGKKAWEIFSSIISNPDVNWMSCDSFIKKWVI